MKKRISYKAVIIVLTFLSFIQTFAQESIDSSLLSIDRIYSGEFSQQYERKIHWIENGNSYITIEKSNYISGADDLISYNSATLKRTLFLDAKNLQINGKSLSIESFSLSPDGTKILIFTNSTRVWRSNTKGDYWVYDLQLHNLKQLGTIFSPSSLLFAKFSIDNRYVFYVHNFNIYKEDFVAGTVTQLTTDGNGDIINGTFDWVYEEEFGKRDGFNLSPTNKHIAFWQLDASTTRTFYMINNIDSIYSKPIPIQYPKVGQEPSAAKIGIINLATEQINWIPLEGGEKENYIPGIQWVHDDLLLIQQMNRHQNRLTLWSYNPSNESLRKVYTEKEETWVDISYPDISANNWDKNDLILIENNTSFLRMTENDKWRHTYKVNISTGKKTLVTPFNYDVASMRIATKKNVFFIASPDNSTQRYLYKTDLKGKGNVKRITPKEYVGLNNYNIAPNGNFAIHTHQSIEKVRTVRIIHLPEHTTIKTLVNNEKYSHKLASLNLPKIIFQQITTDEGITLDVRMVLPINFDSTKKYPVLFHVYGEPWSQQALDKQIGEWNILMAQKGYVIIDLDNRGTPCLRGSAWRKSIYRKFGVVNAKDQALAAKELLKINYLDQDRTCVWGWSGGGTMTLTLMLKYPEIYKTGIAVAAVSNLLIYDNIYMERYMGLPQENTEDYKKGSPVNYAKNLEGNLLIIHGTGDDNVHYQSMELMVNALIKENKQFQMMSYPNRSHGIDKGKNTRQHLYTLITNYILNSTPINK